MVVHSLDGLDEISLAADTRVAELKDGVVEEYTLTPEDLGLGRGSLKGLGVEGVDASLDLLTSVLEGEGDPRSQRGARLVALNAGAALYVAGVADSAREGVEMALEVLASGAALDKLNKLADLTQEF